MRTIYVLTLLLVLPLTTSAQQRSKHAQDGRNSAGEARHDQRSDQQRPPDQPRPEQRPTTGLGTIGLSLPPIGLPPANAVPYWEQKGIPAWEQQQAPRGERPHTTFDLRQIPGWEQGNVARAMLDQRNQRPANDRRNSKYDNKPSVVYVVPAYGYYPNTYLTSGYLGSSSLPTEVAVEQPLPPEPPPSSMGALRIEVEPRELLQIFVDGLYVGTPADLGDLIELRIGARRIELRAAGYRTLVFDAEISPDRLITYRGALEPSTPAASTPPPSPMPPVAVPTGSKTMYLIPGCYMGNVSPKDMALPAGCDIKKLVTITP